jgi:hypothetical protein
MASEEQTRKPNGNSAPRQSNVHLRKSMIELMEAVRVLLDEAIEFMRSEPKPRGRRRRVRVE